MSLHKNQPFMRRLRFAYQGLRYGLAERSFRFQLCSLAALLVFLLILRPGAVWWGLALLSSAAVLAAELFNTAIEHLIDHLHPELHPRIKIVKDCAAAAVLLTCLGALAVGVMLLLHLLARL
jgi:diacylglycerol kinase (ATP)